MQDKINLNFNYHKPLNNTPSFFHACTLFKYEVRVLKKVEYYSSVYGIYSFYSIDFKILSTNN